MTVRVGHIEFLNCYPLYYGLKQRAAQGIGSDAHFELVPGVPTDLNRMLLAGTIDFGPISSIAYARGHRQLALSSRLSISANGAVDSIRLLTPNPLDEIRSVALTPQSATAVALLKTILQLWHHGDEVTYGELMEPPATALDHHDAVLLIGDQALAAMYDPLPGVGQYDLGEVWRVLTGRPMVYAVWATRLDFLKKRPEELRAVEEELVRSMDYGRDHVVEMVESALKRQSVSETTHFDRPCLTRYFRILHYGFSNEYQDGLRHFYDRAHEAGELPDRPELHFIDRELGRQVAGTAGGGANGGEAST